MTSTSTRLSKEQQEIWGELVDDSKFSPSPSILPENSGVSITNRQCCESPIEIDDDDRSMCCETCGLTTAHRIVLYSAQPLEDIWPLPGRPSDYVGKLDYFNNTPLHCAATSCDEKTLELLAIRHSIHVNLGRLSCTYYGVRIG